VTYVLEIAVGEHPAAQSPTVPFFVLTLDGLVAGTPIENEPTELLGVGLQRLLLMPGSRAEIFLPPGNCGSISTLRTIGIQTGPGGNPAPTGDPWPAIELARAESIGPGGCPQSQAFASVARPSELNIRIPARDALLSRPQAGADAQSLLALKQPNPAEGLGGLLSKLHPGCVFLPGASEGKSYRRRIVFEQNSSDFMLGSEIVDAAGSAVAGTKIGPETFPDPINWLTTRHVCPVLGAQEVWELVNNTDEMHNFHIHQSKFRLADATLDDGVPSGLTAVVSTDPNCDSDPTKGAFCDPLGVVGSSVPDAGGAVPDRVVDMWHDTIPVPPRSSPGHPGRVFVSIPFKAPQQEGRFVFHCHILEHEDGGMMAPIEVLTAASIAQRQQDEPLAPMNMPNRRTDFWSMRLSRLIGLFHHRQEQGDFDTALARSICSSGPAKLSVTDDSK
jgi:hypothetical protein